MKKILNPFLILIFFFINLSFAQTNEIKINAFLDSDTHELKIQQEILFYNTSNKDLDTIYLHNWPNSYKDKKSPLSKRLIANYNKDLYFAKEKFRGHTDIKSIAIDYENVAWKNLEKRSDIIKIGLKKSLEKGKSITISSTYSVKIPSNKFTKYGRSKNAYNLRYWYLSPAFNDTEWKLMSNLDMDDLLVDLTNYNITFTVPNEYILNSDLESIISKSEHQKTYNLVGNNRTDIELNINNANDFEVFNTSNISIETNLNSKNLNAGIKTDILNREIAFIDSSITFCVNSLS